MVLDKIEIARTSNMMMQVQSMAGSSSLVPNDIKDSSTIHSGHFMHSRVHEEKDEDDDDDDEVVVENRVVPVSRGYDFLQAKRETSHTYSFGSKSTYTLYIDSSLAKLFECMTLAYSGKITSPKWKPFRGMHLSGKDKVRLNNIIWREWHMQYIFQKRSVVCQFATPVSDDIHTRPEAVVLEGKYWKRRLDTVTKEYKKWRRFFRDRLLQTMPEGACWPISTSHLTEQQLLERVTEVSAMPSNLPQSSTDLSLMGPNSMEVDFSDNLFSCLNQPFHFPTHREFSQFGPLTCADLIQPGLIQLQPSLEDFMDIDTVQELFSVSRAPTFNSTPITPASTHLVPELHSATFHSTQTHGQFSTLTNPASTQLVSEPCTAAFHEPHMESQFQDTLDLLEPVLSGSSDSVNPAMLSSTLSALNSNNNSNISNNINIGAVAAPASDLLGNALFPIQNNMTVNGPLFDPATHTQSCIGIDLGIQPPNEKHVSQPGLSLQDSLTLQHIATPHQVNNSPQILPTGNLAGLGLTPSNNPVQVTNLAGLGLVSSDASSKSSASSQHAASPLGLPPVEMRNIESIQQTSGVKGSANVRVNRRMSSPSKRTLPVTPVSVSRRTSSPSQRTITAASSPSRPSGKKDNFVVPQGRPMTTARKPRTIAPAPSPPQPSPSPSPSTSVQSTLVRLLTEGVYTGAVINVKAEPSSPLIVRPPASNQPPVQSGKRRLAPAPAPAPAPTPIPTPSVAVCSPRGTAPTATSTLSQSAASALSVQSSRPRSGSDPTQLSANLEKVNGVDFPTRVLLAAASSALGSTPSSLRDALRMNPSNMVTAALTPAKRNNPEITSSPLSNSSLSMALSPSSLTSSSSVPTSPQASVFSSNFMNDVSPSVSLGAVQVVSPPAPASRKQQTGTEGYRQHRTQTEDHRQHKTQTQGYTQHTTQAESYTQHMAQTGNYTQHRRAAHLSAEQKRRGNLRTGFDVLHTLVPALASNPRVSKATMLQKTAEHIRKIKAERDHMNDEARILKKEIEHLNEAINDVQSQLPETGVPVTRQRVTHMNDMFENYVRLRTMQEWKFWIFASIMRDVFNSYNNMVSTANVEELCRTTTLWLEQHCSLITLRPTALNALKHMSVTTSILTEPGRIQEQATQAVTKGSRSEQDAPDNS